MSNQVIGLDFETCHLMFRFKQKIVTEEMRQ